MADQPTVGMSTDKRTAYLLRGPNGIEYHRTDDPRSLPAATAVDIDTHHTLVGTCQMMAWLAYPEPDKNADRENAHHALLSWVLRSAIQRGFMSREDLWDNFSLLRSDRVKSRINRLMKRVEKRYIAAGPYFDTQLRSLISGLLLGAKLQIQVGKHTSLSEVARHQNIETADNRRNRIWQQSRPVLHLAHALWEELWDIYYKAPPADEPNIDWQNLRSEAERKAVDRIYSWGPFHSDFNLERVLKNAESMRLTTLPLLEPPIELPSTIQFRSTNPVF